MNEPLHFKIWIHLERIHEAEDAYEDIGLPDSIGTYPTVQEAEEVILEILQHYNPEEIPTSDHRRGSQPRHPTGGHIAR